MSSDTWCLASGALGWGGVVGPLRTRAWAGRFMSVGSMPLMVGFCSYPFPATILMPGEQHHATTFPVHICCLTQAPKPNNHGLKSETMGPSQSFLF